VDKSSLWAPCQNDPYKNTQNISKHGVYKGATVIKNNYILCFFRCDTLETENILGRLNDIVSLKVNVFDWGIT